MYEQTSVYQTRLQFLVLCFLTIRSCLNLLVAQRRDPVQLEFSNILRSVRFAKRSRQSYLTRRYWENILTHGRHDEYQCDAQRRQWSAV